MTFSCTSSRELANVMLLEAVLPAFFIPIKAQRRPSQCEISAAVSATKLKLQDIYGTADVARHNPPGICKAR